MGQKKQKITVIIIAAIVLTTTIVWASNNANVRKLFSAGGAPAAAQDGKSTYGSVSNGSFTLTLEKAVSFEEKTAIVYSIEALTDEQKARMAGSSFNSSISVRVPQGSGIVFNFIQQERELIVHRTDTKRYYTCFIYGLENPEKLPLSFYLNQMAADELYIEVPMDTTELLELTLDAGPGQPTIIELSPVDISIEKDIAEGFSYATSYTEVFFRMQDDSIKTFNELFRFSSSYHDSVTFYTPERPRYSVYGVANDILDISEFKSIIVENLEYDLSDTSQVKETALDETLLPFHFMTMSGDTYGRVPVKEVIEKLGGEITLDASGQHAVMQYRGITVEIWAGEEYCLRNGMRYEVDFRSGPVALIMDETLVMDSYLFDICFGTLSDPYFENDTSEGYLLIP